MPTASDWYADFFDDDYLRVFGPDMGEEVTSAEVDGVEALLALPPGSRVLDLCCGQGRHLAELVARGHRAVGVDRSPVLLRRARRSGPVVRADMRALPFGRAFDAVVNLFNSFGYLESADEDRRVLTEVRRVLVDDGVLLQEVANRDALVRSWTPSAAHRLDGGALVVEERRFDQRHSRHDARYTVIDPSGEQRVLDQSVRVYTLTELEAMYAAADLHLETVLGDLAGNPLELDSPSMVLRARAV